MVRVRSPLFSLSARGWLGKYTYSRIGVVSAPYPIAMFNFRYSILLDVAEWADETARWSATNRTWDGHRPNLPRAFLSFYYHRKGWCYQRRRTWHGIIWAAMKPPISTQPQTDKQENWKYKFGSAVRAWQAMDQDTKDIYNAWKYPVHASGYNRFISKYLREQTPALDVSADTGWEFPTATGDDFNDWDNPAWAYVCNNSRADGSADSLGNIEYQDYYNFGFSFPAFTTIVGIEVSTEGYSLGGTPEGQVSLSWDGGANYTAVETELIPETGPNDSVVVFGGAADLWGRSWTPAELSDSNFRVKINVKQPGAGVDVWNLDCLKVRVYYVYVT